MSTQNTGIKNKWILTTKETYQVGEETVVKTDIAAIPPTSGDRVDVVGTSGRYYYDVNPKKLKLYESGREKDNVNFYIVIKNGEPTITHKFK
jgi:hypothetical protein